VNRVIGTCCLAVCLTPSNTPLDGRWDVTFDIPSQQYRAILEFAVSSDGTVTTTNLVYPLLTVTEGHFTDGTLSLKGTSPYGPVGITTAIAGTAMTGKWQVAMISGAVRGSRMPDIRSGVRPRAVFDAVCRAHRPFSPRCDCRTSVDGSGFKIRVDCILGGGRSSC